MGRRIQLLTNRTVRATAALERAAAERAVVLRPAAARWMDPPERSMAAEAPRPAAVPLERAAPLEANKTRRSRYYRQMPPSHVARRHVPRMSGANILAAGPCLLARLPPTAARARSATTHASRSRAFAVANTAATSHRARSRRRNRTVQSRAERCIACAPDQRERQIGTMRSPGILGPIGLAIAAAVQNKQRKKDETRCRRGMQGPIRGEHFPQQHEVNTPRSSQLTWGNEEAA